MAGLLLRAALRRSLDQIRHVEPVRPRHADGLVARVYRQVERDFGMLAPPVALHSPAPETLAAAWTMLRESLVATGLVDRAVKEIVATQVSAGNACPYCVEVHGAAMRGLGHSDPGPVGAWASASGTRELAAGSPVPFPAEHGPEMVGVAATFQYLNRMVHVFLGESPLPPTMPAAARGKAQRFLGWFMGASARKVRVPGAALELLPDAPPAEDLSWAAGNPTVAGGFARAFAAIDAAGERSVPPGVRDLLATTLSTWDGQPTGPGRAWVTGATTGLPAGERAAGRLALLTAMAAYQVDQTVIDDFRRERPGDRTLIELTSWASLTAARHVARWVPTIGPAQPARAE